MTATPSNSRKGAAHDRFTAIAMMVAAVCMFAAVDAAAKFATAYVVVLQVVWLRYAFHLAIGCVLFAPWRRENIAIKAPAKMMVRGVLLVAMTGFNYWGLLYLQLDQTVAIIFSTPLFVALLSIPLLGERIGVHRWAAIAVGFVGVLIVARPGLGGLGWPALLILIAVICYSLYLVMTRMLAATESTSAMWMMPPLVGTVVLAPFVVVTWVTPETPWHLIFAAIPGVFGAIGHYVVILAHRRAPAPTLAPFQFTQIIWMVLFGYVLFGDQPDQWSMLGAIVVILASLYTLYREQRAVRR